MHRIFAGLLVILGVASASTAAPAAVDAEALRAALVPPTPFARSFAAETSRLVRLYESRDHTPIWVVDGDLTAKGWAALRVIATSIDEGLDPEMYYAPEIESLLVSKTDDARLRLELTISGGLLRYVSHVAHGRLEPKAADPELFVYPDPPDPMPILAAALDAPDFAGAMAALAPQHEGYRRLKRALARYYDMSSRSIWPKVPIGGAMRRGDSGPRVAALRQRLAATGDLSADDIGGDTFDSAVDAAVKRMQRRFGLDADGIVGERTLAALNSSIEDRIRQIIVNMERWRWLERTPAERYIVINAAGFALRVVDGGTTVLEMPVIVGRPYRRTPMFSSRVTHFIVNPDWTVPVRIARQDILPKLRTDPDYLTREGFQVYDGWSPAAPQVDPSTVDWTAVSARSFAYTLRQKPGPTNALGQIKFMLPNTYNVYLHDTPHRELFQRTERSFSSGCVRLGDPLELALYLMRDVDGWDAARLERLIQSGRTEQVNLTRALPVYFTYFTAWVDDDDMLQFRSDIYERDSLLYAALKDQLLERRIELDLTP